jgi:hypothetical protein
MLLDRRACERRTFYLTSVPGVVKRRAICTRSLILGHSTGQAHVFRQRLACYRQPLAASGCPVNRAGVLLRTANFRADFLGHFEVFLQDG